MFLADGQHRRVDPLLICRTFGVEVSLDCVGGWVGVGSVRVCAKEREREYERWVVFGCTFGTLCIFDLKSLGGTGIKSSCSQETDLCRCCPMS